MHRLCLATLLAASLALGSCSPARIVDLLLPEPPAYPDFQSRAAVLAEAQAISDGLEQHILAWLDGQAPAEIPTELLPPGIATIDLPYRLVRPEEVSAEDQWIVRPAEKLDHSGLRGLYPDPHCTYLLAPALLAPFGHRVVVEGEFPHTRFFDLQVSPPLDPAFYYYAKQFGAAEVPIVDADIEPMLGHTNPFRPGADRTARRRSYQVTFEMRVGNGYDIEPAYREPLHRRPGNLRYGSAIQYQGPLAHRGLRFGHDRGPWDEGTLWARYYAPDRAKGPLAGVPLPKFHYETPDGRRYFVLAVNRARDIANVNRRAPARQGQAGAPDSPYTGADFGWMRDLGIFHGGVVGVYAATGKDSPADKARGRALVRGVAAKGGGLPPPGSDMSSNSRVPYISYLSRGLNLEEGHVAVLTGTLPTHPETLGGERRMGTGQLRYLSFTLYPDITLLDNAAAGVPHASVMDENLALDARRRYTVVYSRPEDRPSNASAPGVTWQNWGPAGASGLVVRWLTVHPDWRDPAIVPDASNISYDQASWLSPSWDPSLVSRNDRSGLLGVYQPLVHYMSRERFERLGASLAARDTPLWEQ